MVQKFIPLSVPCLKGNELKYVTEAIETEWVSTGGSFITDFEKKFAGYINSECVAVQSGTAALHLAYLQAGVRQDDLVICPTLTFIAAVNPIKYLNAKPVFIDCDDSLCIDPDKIK
ncbi:MAG: DegT/DnrJ/EryC1/StrS family aminotransferase, partial [Oscillospiraceae bacterium]|nr:DegT/DnrJ/EryC1/StrS family aminotransferase [Oscillospiraceae bacterium]